MNFTAYLQQKKLSASTVKAYTRRSSYFLAWLQQEDISTENFTYTDLLDFMRYCTAEQKSKRNIHALLGTVRHYSNHLILQGKRNDNPAAGIFIKGLSRKLPINLLSVEEMEELFKQYSIQLNVDSSKKIMFGLMVYQGLMGGELMRIESKDIKIKEGKIFIKGTKRSNERLLDLQALQMAELQSYLQKNKFKEGAIFTEQKLKILSDKNVKNRVQYMFDQLKKLNAKVINAKQIRSSVITEWLRKNNLRQVQYMAGHKYVSSTERYQTNNLDDLQNELQQHHPMK
ncbi:MAG: tyrosine-type recombinase/integrase [Aquabacterium sp.]|nr:tyrosine-type recombinase/integrase [Ferruginibacter sp.]